ncbi:MAG: chloride channel protein [Magnetovibrio sp.]|nr:chloride channel protein [Magnetovibrio sp.]
MLRNDHLILSVLALVVGCIAGAAVVVLREMIALVQFVGFRAEAERLADYAAELPWWHVIAVPTVGGLVVGVLVYRFLPDRRPQGVADVIEATALRSGRMSSRVGIMAALVNGLSVGAGASVGREGPAVHLGASLSGWIGRRLHLSRSLTRTLLGCGVASAVAASFNAPIAGALFANEVVVGHYALKAFAPVVIASVAGTAISRSWFGDFPAFTFNTGIIASFWEFPAFVLLGICAGITAVVFMKSISWSAKVAQMIPVPPWLRPAIGGFAVGLMATQLPQVLGVGYAVTESALLLQISLTMLIVIGVAKVAATAICLGFGFGGGVFSPSLVIGATVGGAFGIIATAVFPEFSSGPGAYTIVGMGAVAAAVMGAPISTTLIIFEMTSNYALTLAVMVAVVIASEITLHFHGRSFFSVQLLERGIDVKGGFESEVMRSIKIGKVVTKDGPTVTPGTCLQELREKLQESPMGELFVLGEAGQLYGTVTLADLSESAFDHEFDDLVNAGDVARLHPPFLTLYDNLETALTLMTDTGEEHIAVVDNNLTMNYRGCVHHSEVMAAYNKALVEARHEEHGE